MENVRSHSHSPVEVQPGGGTADQMVTPQGCPGTREAASTNALIVTQQDVRHAWECFCTLDVHKPIFSDWVNVTEEVMYRMEQAYEEAAAGLTAQRVAERLALRRLIGHPNAGIMMGQARQHLKALRRAQLESPGELPVLEAEATSLAHSLLGDIGDATLLACEYGEGVAWANAWMGRADAFLIDREGRWHRTRYYDHKGQGYCHSGDIDDLSDALGLLRAIADHDYAARCLAFIAHGDCDLAYDEPLIDFGDPDTHAFYGIDEPANTPRV